MDEMERKKEGGLEGGMRDRKEGFEWERKKGWSLALERRRGGGLGGRKHECLCASVGWGGAFSAEAARRRGPLPSLLAVNP